MSSITARHCGQERPSGASFVDWRRQARQKECPHCSVSGSTYGSRQMAHVRSGSVASADMRNVGEIPRTFLGSVRLDGRTSPARPRSAKIAET